MHEAQTVTTLGSDEHCFVLVGVAQHPDPVADTPANTLLEWLDHTPGIPADLIVQTGSQSGPFEVTLHLRPDAPAPETPGQPTAGGPWEDVVEISLQAGPEFGVGELVDGPVDLHDVPTDTYRLRVSARGRAESAAREMAFGDDEDGNYLDDRDDRDDRDEDDALEHYLIELWPSPPASAVIARQDSQHARNLLDPPAPDWPAERDPGLIAAWAIVRDVRREPHARILSGALGEVTYAVEVPGTPTRMYNRVKHANGWPTSNGGMLSLNEEVGDHCFHYGDLPDTDRPADLAPPPADRSDELGLLETRVLEIAKPRRFAMAWNWRLPDADGYARHSSARLLNTDSTVTMTFAKANGQGEEPRTLIGVHHTDVPVEWVTDLTALWAWDVTRFASRK